MKTAVALALCAVTISFAGASLALPSAPPGGATRLDDEEPTPPPGDGPTDATCTGIKVDARAEPVKVSGTSLCAVAADRKAKMSAWDKNDAGHVVVSIPKPSAYCGKDTSLEDVTVTYTLIARYPEWSASDNPGVSETEQDRIESYVARIKRHEDSHLASYKEAFEALSATGKSKSQFDKSVEAATSKADEAAERLDSQEGCVEITTMNPGKDQWCTAAFKPRGSCK